MCIEIALLPSETSYFYPNLMIICFIGIIVRSMKQYSVLGGPSLTMIFEILEDGRINIIII